MYILHYFLQLHFDMNIDANFLGNFKSLKLNLFFKLGSSIAFPNCLQHANKGMTTSRL